MRNLYTILKTDEITALVREGIDCTSGPRRRRFSNGLLPYGSERGDFEKICRVRVLPEEGNARALGVKVRLQNHKETGLLGGFRWQPIRKQISWELKRSSGQRWTFYYVAGGDSRLFFYVSATWIRFISHKFDDRFRYFISEPRRSASRVQSYFAMSDFEPQNISKVFHFSFWWKLYYGIFQCSPRNFIDWHYCPSPISAHPFFTRQSFFFWLKIILTWLNIRCI